MSNVAAACIHPRALAVLFEKVFVFYPIPTHSRHNLIALPSTMAASPLAAPKVSMLTPVIRKNLVKSLCISIACHSLRLRYPALLTG